MLREENRVGKVTIFNSREDKDIIDLSYKLFNMK